MTPFVLDRRPGVALGRGVGWGAVAGAASGALFVAPVVIRNGPWAALLVYPPLAALPGAVIGIVVGAVSATVLVAAGPVTRAGARTLAAVTGALCVGWTPLLFGALPAALWVLVLAVVSGALLGPTTVSARRSGVAAATGTGSPGSSRAPGR